MRITVCDRWGNPIDDLDNVTRAIRTRSVDGTDTLDLTLLDAIGKDERIVLRDGMGRWCEYIVQETDTVREDGRPVTTANCSNSMCVLSRCWIEDRRPSGNASACLSAALEGTGWEPGTVQAGTVKPDAAPTFYHCSVLDAIQSIADAYGLEIQTEVQPDSNGNRIGRRIVHMLDQRGSHTASKRFEYGKDLAGITRTVDPSDVVTRLYGWGKGVQTTDAAGETTGGYGRKLDFSEVNNGLKYVEDKQATDEWGIPGPGGVRLPSVGSVEFGECEDPDELLRLTRDQLKTMSQPVVSYEADVVALGASGIDPEGVDVGDVVQIVDTTFTPDLRLDGRILKIEEDLVGDLSDTTITLGNIGTTWTQRLAAQQQALDKLVSNSGAWDSAAAGTGPYIGDLIDRVNQVMNATGGYVYLVPGQGIYVYDRPIDQNPTQAIQIGGGYWRIADKRKSDGDWDWRSLANGHGIFADTIFTGKLSDAAGLNFWDLDTGEFSLSARATVGGQTVDSIAQGKADAAEQAAIEAAKQAADQADLDKLNEAKQYAAQQAQNALDAAKADATDKADNAQSNAEKAAQAYVDALDESLGQRSIFDRLTNNGQTQGIYLNGGLLYINGTYIKTGVIDAALVKAGIISDKRGLNFWDLDTGEMRTTSMQATDIDATGQITSTSGGTSAAIRGGTMTYSNSAGGRFSITNDRLSSGSSWVNLVADNVDNLVFHNETNDSHASVYVMCGPGYVDTTKLALVYGQFASLDCDDDNDLIISDNGAQINSTGFLTLQCDQLTSGEKLLDFGQGTSSDSDIWIGMPRNRYRPCLRIGNGVCQISCNNDNRVDLSSTYAALVHGDYHVMVNSSGVSQTTRAASATSLQADMLDKRLMALADEGVDLSDPSGYTAQPAAIDEITVPQIHEILRLVVDGDTDGAKTLLDQYESEQHIWTQAELDEFDVMSKTDHPTGQAQADRTAYKTATA